MTNKEITIYLSFKRKFSKNRLFTICFLNILFLLIELTLLLSNGHYILALVLFLSSSSLSIIGLNKVFKLKTLTDSYDAAIYIFINTYIVFGLIFYVFLYGQISIVIYFILLIALTPLMALINQKIICRKIKNVRFPRFKFSESLWVLIIGMIAITSESVFEVNIIENEVIGSLVFILWIIFGTYSFVDIYYNYQLSKSLR